MMNMLKSIGGMFMIRPEIPALTDPTVYQVETAIRKYCGKIIYQDDKVIKLKGFKPKVVKILKSNIDRITVIRTEAVLEYNRWLPSRHLCSRASIVS